MRDPAREAEALAVLDARDALLGHRLAQYARAACTVGATTPDVIKHNTWLAAAGALLGLGVGLVAYACIG